MTTDKTGKPSAPAEVEEYLKALKHPRKEVLEALRRVILKADRSVGEEVKWNAPAFFYTGLMAPSDPKLYRRYLVISNVFRKDCIRLVFWQAARVKDPSGLLEGDYADGRRLAHFRDVDDVKAKGKALANIIKQQVTHMRILALVLLLPVLPARSASAQQAPTPACALLTMAEVRSITGNPNYPAFMDGEAEGEGLGGGSSCQYGGADMDPAPDPPLLSVVLIKGKDGTAKGRNARLRAGCKLETVAGVGDDAYFETCADRYPMRTPNLYVKVGSNDLVLQIDILPPATDASMRQVLVALAKAAVKQLR